LSDSYLRYSAFKRCDMTSIHRKFNNICLLCSTITRGSGSSSSSS